MKRMKKILAIMLVLALALSLVACGQTKPQPQTQSQTQPQPQQGDTPSESEKPHGLKVGVAFGGWNTNPNWLQLGEMLHEIYDPQGYTFIEVDLTSAEDVPTAVENFISADCDIVLLHGHYKEAASAALEQLHEAGIAVGTFDNDFRGEPGMTYGIRCDDYTTGYFLGEEVAKWCNETLEGKAIVGILGYEAVEAFGSRAWAIKDAMEANMENGEVVIVGDASVGDSYMAPVENMLSAHPDINVMVTIAGSMSLGMYEAAKAAGWDERPENSCGVFGMDATDDELNIILQDTCFKASLDLDLHHQYLLLFEKLIEYVENGNQYPEGTDMENLQKDYPMVLVYKDTAEQYLGSK